MTAKDEKLLKDLNTVLLILRKEADPKTEILAKSCTKLVANANLGFTTTHISRLIRWLTQLGWREDITLAGRRASKLKFSPATITSLEPLAEVTKERAAAAKLTRDATNWYSVRTFEENWIITSASGDTVTIHPSSIEICNKQDEITRIGLTFKLLIPKTMPRWFKAVLTRTGCIGVSTLYQLWLKKQARPAK